MPLNIESWETLSCLLTIPKVSTDIDAIEYDDEGTGVSLHFNENAETECHGTIEGDMIVIHELSSDGEWSGTNYRERLIPFLEQTQGRLEAVLLWEDTQIEHLLVIDGEVNSNEYTPGELIKRINELTAILEL